MLVAAVAAKPALELRLAPPANIYPEVQQVIHELEAKRQAAEAKLDAAIGASFLSTGVAADDVTVKVLPGAAIPHSVLNEIRAVEAARQDAENRMMDRAIASLHRGASFLAQRGDADVDVVVGASEQPWPRVATLVDEMETRRDQAEHQLIQRIVAARQR